jgi:hypothetical protein
MTEHLDRPVWNVLTTEQARLAGVSRAAVRIDPAYGPFAAARDASDESQTALAATLQRPDDRMLSGAEITSEARAQADRLLEGV